ncbi:MAG: hypothetical protein KAI18_03500 [Candidatus Aenigmarchaeota archaeon]|nr:hypothetical protein [Candidatus Aenigmarchaeota archaeon]
MSDNNEDYLGDDSFGDKAIIDTYISELNDEKLYDSFKLRTWLPLYILYSEIKEAKKDSAFDEFEFNKKLQIYGGALVYELSFDAVRIIGIYGLYKVYDFLFL